MISTNFPKVYTDGSCLSNPGGNGGWAVAVVEDKNFVYLVGNELSTTNNRMELRAVIEALKFVNFKEFILYTDSQLTMNCATRKWKRKANLDLWEEYDRISKGFVIHWEWVKAHNGDKYNSIVDKLARNEAKVLI